MADERDPALAQEPSREGRRAGLVAAVILACLAAAAVLAAPLLPFQDLPAHAAILRILSDPERYAPWFVIPAPPWVHSSLTYLLGRALAILLGFDGAVRALVALAVGGLPLAAWAAGRATTGRGGPAAVAGFAVAFGQSVGMGFLPWTLAASFAPAGLAGVAAAMRRRSTAAAVVLAGVGSVVAFGLHFFGYLLFAFLVATYAGRTGRGRARLLVPAAALLPGALLFAAGRLGGGGADIAGLSVPAYDPLARVAAMAGALTLGTRPALDDVVAWAVVGVAILSMIAGAREDRADGGTPARSWARGAALVLALAWALLPDYVATPRLVLPGARLAPIVVVLAALAGPRRRGAGRAATAAMAGCGVLLAGFATTAIHLDGASLATDAARFRALVPGRVLASVAAHRPPRGAVLSGYAGLHLPERYLSAGRGVTLFPFLHADSPVAMRSPYAEDVEVSYADLPTFVARAAGWAHLLAGELGDDARAAAAIADAGFTPCPDTPGAGDWRFWTRQPGPCFAAER